MGLPSCPWEHCGGQLVAERDPDGSIELTCLRCARVAARRPSNRQRAFVELTARWRAGAVVEPYRGRGRPPGSKSHMYDHLLPEMRALVAEGRTTSEIAARLGLRYEQARLMLQRLARDAACATS